MSRWTAAAAAAASVLLLLVCGVPATVLGCDWLSRYGHVNNNSLALLQDLGGEMTNDEPPVGFPYNLYCRIRHAEEATQLAFIRDGLSLISDLYRHGNLSAAAWDPVKTEHFRISIHRQVQELGSCLSSKRGVTKYANRRLRRYFGKLRRRTLRHTGGSAASWEILRVETKDHLIQLEQLVNYMRAESRSWTRADCNEASV